MVKYFVFVLLLKLSAAQFDLQYIGNTLSEEEANSRDLCSNKYCIEDADILFESATQNFSVNPCVDFKEFALGTFIKYRAFNDRYAGVGFWYDVVSRHKERLRKVLASKKEAKNEVFKIMKNCFKKCVSSS